MHTMISQHLKGTIICIIGELVLTPDALLLRCVGHMSNFDVMFIKFSMYTATFVAYFLATSRSYELALKNFSKVGKTGLVAGIVWGISNVLFVLAVQNTYVSNVLVLLAVNPMFSVVLSYVFMRENVPVRTLITCVVSFGAILLVFSGNLNSSKPETSPIGNIFALFASFTFSLYFVILRYAASHEGEEPDMVPCNIIAGLTVMIVALGFGGRPVALSPLEGGYLTLQGVLVNPIAFLCLTIGPSYIPASEVSLWSLIEVLLGPVWVWLAGFERPPFMTVYGGIILCVALTVNSILGIREDQQREQIQAQGTLELSPPVNYHVGTCEEPIGCDSIHVHVDGVQTASDSANDTINEMGEGGIVDGGVSVIGVEVR